MPNLYRLNQVSTRMHENGGAHERKKKKNPISEIIRVDPTPF